MRVQTAIGVALSALATVALAQVANAPGQGNTANVQVDEAAPAANDTLLGNDAIPANGSARSNSTEVEEATSPAAVPNGTASPPPKR